MHFLPKIDVCCLIILLPLLVMGRPKLELGHLEKATGYQNHLNTKIEGCRKVK